MVQQHGTARLERLRESNEALNNLHGIAPGDLGEDGAPCGEIPFHNMIVEPVLSGELFDYVSGIGGLEEDESAHLFAELCDAVSTAHGLGIPEIIHAHCGPNLKAPEFLTHGTSSWGGHDGYAADVWSLGVCLFTLHTGFHPFDEAHPEHDWRAQRVLEAQRAGASTVATLLPLHYPLHPELEHPSGGVELMSQPLHALLDKMLVFEPTERATLQKVLLDEWLAPHVPSLRFLLADDPDTTPRADQATCEHGRALFPTLGGFPALGGGGATRRESASAMATSTTMLGRLPRVHRIIEQMDALLTASTNGGRPSPSDLHPRTSEVTPRTCTCTTAVFRPIPVTGRGSPILYPIPECKPAEPPLLMLIRERRVNEGVTGCTAGHTSGAARSTARTATTATTATSSVPSTPLATPLTTTASGWTSGWGLEQISGAWDTIVSVGAINLGAVASSVTTPIGAIGASLPRTSSFTGGVTGSLPRTSSFGTSSLADALPAPVEVHSSTTVSSEAPSTAGPIAAALGGDLLAAPYLLHALTGWPHHPKSSGASA